MSGIYGLLGINSADSQRIYVNTIGQQVVYDAARMWLARHTQDLAEQMSAFVEMETEGVKERYMLPGGGRLQRRGGLTQSGAVKATGYWDVAYPLEDFGAQLAADDVSLAYMSAADFDRHLSTIIAQNTNTVRYEMMKALFNSTAATFVDPQFGSLTIQRLANGDATLYPAVIGSETEATDSHYLESGYAATAISDTNNPYITIRGELEEHFGASVGGDNIVAFIHPDEVPETEDLTDFDQVEDRFIRVGTNTDVPVNLPSVPGRIIGRTNGVWVVEWRWMPTGYIFGMHLEEPAPLKMRVDAAESGLPRGLQLVAREQNYPLESAHYRHRFGFGVGNRLNGVVMELGVAGTYTVPTGY